MTKYRLSGKFTIWLHCYDEPPGKAEKLDRCVKPNSCVGHLIRLPLTEIIEAHSEMEAIDNSMSEYECFEPTWCQGYPRIKIVSEVQA